MSPKARIGPSILNSDLSNLANECKRMILYKADYLHLDVMDGHFVPNLTFGHPVVQSIRNNIGDEAFLDVHMMVARPEQWVAPMAAAKVNLFTFHLESSDKPQVRYFHLLFGVSSFNIFDVLSKELIKQIRSAKMQVGCAIKPDTPVSLLLELLHSEMCNVALIMTVEPGFGGQSFMENMMPKVCKSLLFS